MFILGEELFRNQKNLGTTEKTKKLQTFANLPHVSEITEGL
jgi:hypothetical protein